MSLKDLFKKNSGKTLEKTSTADHSAELESQNYELELFEEKNRYIPKVDFSEPANFAKFGSAEKYYYDAITSIYNTYPYDGSLYEKLKWQNSNSDIGNFIFENEYPRVNGYINTGYSYGTISTGSLGYAITTNPEYILVKGGPNASTETTLRKKFEKANKLDTINNRDYNLYINGETGLTTEFWLKKDNFSGSSKQVVFDLWNSASLGSNSYGRFTVDLRDSWDISSNISSVSTTLVGEGLPRAIYVKDGYNYYIIGSGTVRQYSSSVEWNTTTLTLVNTSSISSEFTDLQAQGLSFKSDGTKLFVIGTGSAGKVVEYSLSTPWDVTTKTLNNTASVLQDIFMNDMYITPDGTSLFGLGDNNNRVYKYNFGTPWDISTLSYTSITASLPVATWNGLYFKDNGTRMYAATTTSIFEYDLSIPWDITTAKLVNNTSIAGTTCGISINNEGKNLFIARFSGTPPNYIGTLTSYTLSSANKINLTISSGSVNITSSLGSNLNITGAIWNHYSINAFNSGSSFKTQLYVNGELNDQQTFASKNINEVTGAYIATIGSLVSQHTSSATTALGYGKLSASLDEFRFWKSKRSDKQIKRYWFTQVGGGTNTDDANTNLGLYYKFNEGIYDNTNISSYDKKIIDYSGRISNGNWTGYVVGSRVTGSAMVIAGAADSEFEDPILYSTHPDIVNLLSEKTQSGSYYDIENNSAMINSFPEWMLEEDAGELKNLSQIASEYFDDLYLKIKSLPEIHESSYVSGSDKPNNFASRLLESHGFMTADMFTDASILETFLSRNEKQIYVDKIYNLKNFIYQNIYNNLNYIYKSKGTEKSIRNFLKSYGVDENLIKVNLYSNNTTFTFDDRYTYTSAKKKYIDLNNVDRFSATVYQTASLQNINSLSYIPADSNNSKTGATLEGEVIFPKKYDINSSFYVQRVTPKVSLFGMHSANPLAPNDLIWSGSDPAGLQVFLNTNTTDPDLSYFSLTSSYLGINLTSSNFREVYNNEKWNISVKIYNAAYPLTNILSTLSQSYVVEFNGYNSNLDSVMNSFTVSASISSAAANDYFSSAKRIYAGAHRTNFTGSVLQQSDGYISSIRYWLSALDNDALIEHSKDPLNYGAEKPFESILSDTFIPYNETLALHWSFENVTGSDNGSGTGPSNTSDAKFLVEDITSGSISRTNTYGWVGDITKYQFIGTGDFFLRNDSSVVRREMVNSAKRKLPEVLNDADMINILTEDDLTFTRDSAPVNHYFTLEKSMYQAISDEMIKMFGTFTSLNNLVGEPVNRYRQDYKKLGKLRELFFDKIQNDIDVEKYVEFFKWFDQSIGLMIEQLIPLSANFSSTLKTVIESHILERNKYWNKYPTLELKQEPPIDGANGINELKYNWRLGSAPISGLENENCLWWKERAERIGLLNPDRQKILDSSLQILNRKFNTVYDFKLEPITVIDKNPYRTDYVKAAVKFSSNSYLSISASDVLNDPNCNDE